jgi:hypothetical protein
MIDLTKSKTISNGYLQKLGVKRNSRTNDLVYEMELSYSVENLNQAQTLDSIIGGTESAFNAHLDNSENKIFIKSNTNNSSWVLDVLDDNNKSVISRMIDVTIMSFNTSHIGCFLSLKIKTLKGKDSDASIFASMLGEKIKTSFENPQQSLFNFDVDDEIVSNINLIGGVEARTGESVVGIKISEDENKVILDDFGKHIVVLKNEITTELILDSEGFIGFCDDFRSMKEDVSPIEKATWLDVIPHLVMAIDPSTDSISLKNLDIINGIREDVVSN